MGDDQEGKFKKRAECNSFRQGMSMVNFDSILGFPKGCKDSFYRNLGGG